MLTIILRILFWLICIALCVFILSQQGKEMGLSTPAGQGGYYKVNKRRMGEGVLRRGTWILFALFLILAYGLNLI